MEHYLYTVYNVLQQVKDVTKVKLQKATILDRSLVWEKQAAVL